MLLYSDQRHLPIIYIQVLLMFHYSKTSIINVNSPDLYQDSTNTSTTQLCSAELSVPLIARLSSCLATAQHIHANHDQLVNCNNLTRTLQKDYCFTEVSETSGNPGDEGSSCFLGKDCHIYTKLHGVTFHNYRYAWDMIAYKQEIT